MPSAAFQPRTAKLAKPVQVPIVINGKVNGSVTLEAGTVVTILAESGAQVRIRTKAGEAWVSADFIASRKNPVPSTSFNPVSSAGERGAESPTLTPAKVLPSENTAVMQVEETPVGNLGGDDVAMALDGDSLYAGFFTDQGLYFAKKNAAGWSIEPVDLLVPYSAITQLHCRSLFIDPSRQPHLFYSIWLGTGQNQRSVLKHAFREGAQWHIETVIDSGDSVLSLTKVSDSCTSLIYGERRIPMFVRLKDHSWESALPIPEIPIAGSHPPGMHINGLVFGKDEAPMILTDPLVKGTGLLLARLNHGEWKTTTVDPKLNEAKIFAASLAVNEAGLPRIVYYRSDSNTVHLVREEAGDPGRW